MLQLKRNLLCIALASAVAANAAHAQEQQKPEAAKQDDAVNLDRVTVTGIQASLDRSIDAKQTSTSIVESISAEDIGKLPDSSIAESIARLPGLTAQRERGRAAQINIRGFAGDFATATLNGREQVSAGDNRSVEFDQYPSELLSGVVVYKTPDARLVGQGLSGTVDMQTVRPLDYDKRVTSFNARYDQNKVRDWTEHGNRLSATYIDQFADHRIGLAIGITHMDSPQPNYLNETWGYTDLPDAANGEKVMGGGKLYKLDDRNKRDGVMATLQFKPNDFYEGTLDVFHSKYDRDEVKTGLEFGTIYGPEGVNLDAAQIAGQTATQTQWSNVHPVLRMDSNPIEDKLDSIGLNNKFTLNDNWLLNVDLATSKLTRKMRYLETYAGVTGTDGTTVDVSLDPSGQFYNYVFGTDFGDPNNLELYDASNWGQDGYLKDFTIEDKLDSFRANLVRTIDEGALSSIDFGVNYAHRTKSKSSVEAMLCIDDCVGGFTDGARAPFPGSAAEYGFGGLDQLASYDANSILGSGVYNFVYKHHADIAAKNWSVDEKLTTLYFQANIDAELGGMPLRGNAGVQQVYVDQSASGLTTFEADPAGEPVGEGIRYAEFLPSMNLGLEFLPETVVRFAAARQMARPRMDQMRGGLDVTINDQKKEWSGSGGNPKLKPWLADAFDLSLEKYFSTAAGNRGYVGAAYFVKNLKTWVRQVDTEFDFSGFPLPPNVGQVNYPTSNIGTMNQPTNEEGGKIHGYELTASVPLDLLWAPLNGFGLIATYSDTKSDVHPDGPDSTEPMPGLSKYVSNVTAYYERGGFSIRYSRRTRSDFRAETRGYGADYQVVNIKADEVQDVQLNYTFPDTTALKGLSLYVQVSNIGDEPFSTYEAGDPANRPVTYQEYGRTALAGFSYKF